MPVDRSQVSVQNHWIAGLTSKQKFPMLILGYTIFWHHNIKNSRIQGLSQATDLYETTDSLPCCTTAESRWTAEVSGLAIFCTRLVLGCRPRSVVISVVTLGCWEDIKPPVSVRVSALSLPLLYVCGGRRLSSSLTGWVGDTVWCCASLSPMRPACLSQKPSLFQRRIDCMMVLVLHNFWARPNLWSHR